MIAKAGSISGPAFLFLEGFLNVIEYFF